MVSKQLRFSSELVLNLVESCNVDGLDEVFKFGDLFLKLINRYFVIFNDLKYEHEILEKLNIKLMTFTYAANLQLVDAISQWNQLGNSPQ